MKFYAFTNCGEREGAPKLPCVIVSSLDEVIVGTFSSPSHIVSESREVLATLIEPLSRFHNSIFSAILLML